jgi:hypothetical protein
MTVPNFYKEGILVFNSGSSPFNIVGATNITVNTGIRPTEATAAGQVSPSFVGINEAQETINATIVDIGTLVSNGVGATVVPIGSGQTITSVVFYATQFQQDGYVVMSGGNQFGMSFTVSAGMVTLNSAQARQGGTATAQITIHAQSSDGFTPSILPALNQSIPTIPILTNLYTVGPAEVNGSTIGSVRSTDYNANFKIEKPMGNGQIYPTIITVSEFKPKFNITCFDASLYFTYMTNSSGNAVPGTALGSSTYNIYFLQMANMGGRVTNATTTHIKFAGSASQGMIWADNVSLNPADGEVRLHICPIVGSSAIVAISEAAIT